MRKVKIVALWDYILQLKEIIWAAFEYKVTGGEAVVAPPPKEDLDGISLVPPLIALLPSDPIIWSCAKLE
jgi:hypothetical protein